VAKSSGAQVLSSFGPDGEQVYSIAGVCPSCVRPSSPRTSSSRNPMFDMRV
jgi:hypothetical protein